MIKLVGGTSPLL